MAVLNVRTFGAMGDGATDDRAAIQAAIDAWTIGDTVFIPAGDYRLGDSLDIGAHAGHDGLTLKGEGPSSVLRLGDGVVKTVIGLPAVYLSFAFRATGITISDLVVDGNLNGPGAAETGDYFGIQIKQTANLTVSRVTVRNLISDGITASNGNQPNIGLVIEDCLVTGVHRNGIHVGFADGFTLRRNRIMEVPSQRIGLSAAHGIDCEVEGYDLFSPDPKLPFVRNGVIEDNLIHRTAAQTSGAGVSLQPAFGPLSAVTIRRNLISGYQNAIEMTGLLDFYGEIAGVHGITVANNWFTCDPTYAVAGYSMAIGGVDGLDITGNVVNDGTNGAFSGYSIAINTCRNVTITGNTFNIWYAPEGLSSMGQVWASTNVTVTGNFYRTSNNVQFVDHGTSTGVVVSGNTSLEFVPWDRIAPACSFSLSSWPVISASTPITVTATDAGSAIARVDFLVDGIPSGTSSIAPYTFTFNPALYTAGLHELSALAVDAGGNFGAPVYATVQVGFDLTTGFLAETGDALLLESGYVLVTEASSDPIARVLMWTKPDGTILMFSQVA